MSTRLPNFYRPPLGLPMFWRDEMSGELAAAVEAYLADRRDDVPMSYAQVILLRDYICHYVNAPCWENEEFARELAALREAAPRLNSPDAIAGWIWAARGIGMDPL
jgi:hypothetical protein